MLSMGYCVDKAIPAHIPLGLCQRRQWPEPLYDTFSTRRGYTCIVRVNNREYHTEAPAATERLAHENAAMRAYLICRNFSVSDGMYPACQTSGSRSSTGSVTQGLPIAIGTERGAGSGSSGRPGTSDTGRSAAASPETRNELASSGLDSGESSRSGSRSSEHSPADPFSRSYANHASSSTHRPRPVGRVLTYGPSRRR